MPKNMINDDIRTFGYILRRTNYGEADRILNLITPYGKVSVIAKGVRKSRSKLAGGIELFTLADYNIHFGRNDLGVLTGAKMVKYYDNIPRDFSRIELAGLVLKKISVAADSSESPDYYKITDESLRELNNGVNLLLIEAWFLINLVKAMGEQINLYRDINGDSLKIDERYSWDEYEACFCKNVQGEFTESEIKLLRLIWTNDLSLLKRVKTNQETLELVLRVARTVAKT